jgi:hypothetical protein
MAKKAKKSKPAAMHFDPRGTVVDPPPEVAAVLDRASETDRIWFEQHPGENVRHRLPVEGEFWPHSPIWVDLVLVFQVRPGFRHRLPLVRLSGPGTEQIQ